MKIVFYKQTKSPVYEYIKRLQVCEKAKILACLKSVEELGFDTPRANFRQINGKLWEIKISNHRIFYVTIQHDTITLLHIYKKQSQKAPPKEIKIAHRRMLEMIENENHYIN